MTPLAVAVSLADRGWLPDPLVRWGIRRACAERLRDEQARRSALADDDALAVTLEALRRAPVAPVPDAANAQHYEVPAGFFRRVLGPKLKYSCAWWGDGVETLAEAEDAALAATIARAGVADGMRVLDLGCGWGSLSLEMARRFPKCRIVGVSNSTSQRRYVEGAAARAGLTNLTIQTADVNRYDPDATFDRIVSVEMFEHVRNYETLLARLARWLVPDGALFVHIFCHRRFTYPFEGDGAGNWMGRTFFSGGLMPGLDLLPAVPSPLQVTSQWHWDGRHYARTARAWLDNLDAHRDALLPILAGKGGRRDGLLAHARWRLFFLACEELFATANGREWGVAHYRFEHRREAEGRR
jgi:cyclopropane-fatty-acyl-phospholipid synthase